MFLTDHLIPPIEHYVSLIQKCISSKNLKLGMSLHSRLIKTSLCSDLFFANHLINMYSKCGSIGSARKAFDDLPVKETHCWKVIISGYSWAGHFEEALNLFDRMPQRDISCFNALMSGFSRHGLHKDSVSMFRILQKEYRYVCMDEYTMVGIVGNFACLGALMLLRQVHAVAVVIGLEFNRIVYNALINAYGKCGELDVSHKLFDLMADRDMVTWTSMVAAYAQADSLDDALRLFGEMPSKNAVSWTALIMGFVRNGRGLEALNLFSRMQEEGVRPGPFTFVGVLSACADLALIERGRHIHAQLIRCSTINDFRNIFVNNALIDMYCKCGSMRAAEILFERMLEKDIVSWNSMITGFSRNGLGHKSVAIFKKMVEENVKPNNVTFLAVLSACSHAGLDFEALKILDSMEKDYGVSPRSDHLAIMVDLFGRKNRLEEAMEIIERVPDKSNHVGLWGSFLGACRVHGNLDVARRAAEALFELEPRNAGRYVMLSNIYAADNRWDDARRVRKLMEERGLRKDLANSWIEVKDVRHEFAAKERYHGQIDCVYDVLRRLTDHIKESGYVPKTNSTYISLDDDGS
ncbi:hypothetical protein CRG98_000172 [Punica granatum]|uniref:Pentatricopeptide repeat-containing protein At2g21090-like n=1 Tax=Punica granatum TaxID=22663 RepID=A0A2I0LFH6_PUNGR|nr:hypothetical protein CRG98_000172 [Punica granatum]